MKVLPGLTTDLQLEALLDGASSSTVFAPDARGDSLSSILVATLGLMLIFVLLLLIPEHQHTPIDKPIPYIPSAEVYEVTPVNPDVKPPVTPVTIPEPPKERPIEDPTKRVEDVQLQPRIQSELSSPSILQDHNMETISTEVSIAKKENELSVQRPGEDKDVHAVSDPAITGGSSVQPDPGGSPETDPLVHEAPIPEMVIYTALPDLLPRPEDEPIVDVDNGPASDSFTGSIPSGCLTIVNTYLRTCVGDLFTKGYDSVDKDISNGRVEVQALNGDSKEIGITITGQKTTVRVYLSRAQDKNDYNFVVPNPWPKTGDEYTHALMRAARGLCDMLKDENCLQQLEREGW